MMCPKIMDYYVMLNIFPSKLFAAVSLLLLLLRFVAYGVLYTMSNQSSKAKNSHQLQNPSASAKVKLYLQKTLRGYRDNSVGRSTSCSPEVASSGLRLSG